MLVFYILCVWFISPGICGGINKYDHGQLILNDQNNQYADTLIDNAHIKTNKHNNNNHILAKQGKHHWGHRHRRSHRTVNSSNYDNSTAWIIVLLFVIFGLVTFFIFYIQCKMKWQLQMLAANDDDQGLPSVDSSTPLLDDALPILIKTGKADGI